jgi:hypothetical protein
MTGETSDDAQWTGRALARLPAVRPSHGFEAGLLAAYDGWNEKRAAGWTAGLAGAVRSLCHFIWPGVPAWAPVGALAASLLLGLALGVVLPAMDDEGMAVFSLDQPPGFSLLSSDTQEDM